MKCGRRDFQSSRRPAVLLDDDPKASLPSACALQPWQSSRCSTWRRCCITADSSALADALSLVNSNKFRRTHALLLFVFDILLLGAFCHFVLLRNPLKELPPRALPVNILPQSWRNHLERRGLQGQQAARTNRRTVMLSNGGVRLSAPL